MFRAQTDIVLYPCSLCAVDTGEHKGKHFTREDPSYQGFMRVVIVLQEAVG